MLEGAPTRDSIVLLRDFNNHVCNDRKTWKGGTGRNSLPNLNHLNALVSTRGVSGIDQEEEFLGFPAQTAAPAPQMAINYVLLY